MASSKYVGVHWRKSEQKYKASISYQGQKIEAGYSDTERGAAILRDKKILALGLDHSKLQILKKVNK